MSHNGVNDRSVESPPTAVSWWARARVWIATLVVLAIALAVSGYIWRVTAQRETMRIVSQCSHQSQLQVQNIEFKLQQSQNLLQFLRSFFAASEDVHRYEFAEFCRSHLDNIPVVKFAAWAPVTYPDGFETLAECADRHGVANFQPWELDEAGQRTFVQTRPQHFPILFIEPSPPFDRLVGLDIASIPSWAEALEETIMIGEVDVHFLEGVPAIDEVVFEADSGVGSSSLLESEEETFSTQYSRSSAAGLAPRKYLAICSPVFFGGYIPENPFERLTQCGGVLVCVVDVQELLRPLKRWAAVEGINFRLVDLQGTSQHVVEAWERPSSRTERLLQTYPTSSWDIRLPGRVWRVITQPTATYVASRRGSGSWGVLAAGTLCSFLLALYVNVIGGRSIRLQQLVEEKTHELRVTNRRLEAEIEQREKVEKG
ncbi:MAG TPA: CHASE domain-containing protein, partial [Thermogutta sp.]|nr:CHASE domain-containing protein [Thermogutta sp.]